MINPLQLMASVIADPALTLRMKQLAVLAALIEASQASIEIGPSDHIPGTVECAVALNDETSPTGVTIYAANGDSIVDAMRRLLEVLGPQLVRGNGNG